nr:pantetheine-phosphate adenylyltransferase [uncultured Peptostreptococcus sp.]
MMSKKVKAIFAGTFDPITNGHIDIIERASKMFDHLEVGLLINPNKQTLFSKDERMDLIRLSTKHLDNVSVISFDGLLIDYCKKNDISVLVRGVRTIADMEYELQMAHMNRELNDDLETIILPTSKVYSFISSSLIKEVLHFDADVSNLVPKCVIEKIKCKNKL